MHALPCVQPQLVVVRRGARGGTKSVSDTGVCQDGRVGTWPESAACLAHRLAPWTSSQAGSDASRCPLPTRPGHVHAYVLPDEDGWTVVDTGLGLPDARERWAAELDELPGDVRRIFVTHFHPDHVGAAADVAELTGAPVAQGRLDYEQCELVWGGEGWADVLVDWFGRHGVPQDVTEELIGQGVALSAVHPLPARSGAPRARRRPRRAGAPSRRRATRTGSSCSSATACSSPADHLLDRITPTVGLWPASRPDPLGDYLDALEATIALDPRVALPGARRPDRRPGGAST